MGKMPVIGITPGFMRDKNKLCLGKGYADGITKAGGLAVILPLCGESAVIEQILETVDGLVFSGGADIDARFFGEENVKAGGEISPERDQFELLLAKRAIESQKPVFGICRGIQLLNVAMGGTLYQDIHTGRNPGELLKHWQEAPDWYPVHDVEIVPDSALYRVYNTERLDVNSYHHQAVKVVGKGLSAVAKTSDGIIEAVESTAGQFILAVQWHPEMMWSRDPQQLKPFEALVAASCI
jgi:putative glutamine amidotransferase